MRAKALLLLLIILLNTVTGFACALRMSAHAQNEAGGHHHEGMQAAHHHGHETIASVKQQHGSGKYIFTGKNDPCCQGAVNNFIALAKVAPQASHVLLPAPFIYIGTHYQLSLHPVSDSHKLQLLSSLDERRRPPTLLIRIAIQSFRI